MGFVLIYIYFTFIKIWRCFCPFFPTFPRNSLVLLHHMHLITLWNTIIRWFIIPSVLTETIIKSKISFIEGFLFASFVVSLAFIAVSEEKPRLCFIVNSTELHLSYWFSSIFTVHRLAFTFRLCFFHLCTQFVNLSVCRAMRTGRPCCKYMNSV